MVSIVRGKSETWSSLDYVLRQSDQPLLSVVIPAYNEAARIIGTLDELTLYLGSQAYTSEVVVVDDGSDDNTADLVTQWSAGRNNIRLIRIPHEGKGWAVKTGMLKAEGRYRFMCDADLAMPVNWVAAFLENMEAGVDIVIGSREIEGARRFDEPGYRHLMGRIFNRVVRLLAVGGIQDTQCGFKCFTEEAAIDLFNLQRTKGMGFDVEILFLALKKGLSVVELPIDWYHQPVSKVRPGADTVDMLKDTLLIRVRDITGRYDQHGGRVQK